MSINSSSEPLHLKENSSTSNTENSETITKEIIEENELSQPKSKAKKIVRIKRKRNELPLESLLVEEESNEKRKSFKPAAPTRFRLVNTLELNSFLELPSVPIENLSKTNDSEPSKDTVSSVAHSKAFQEFKKTNLTTYHKSSPINASLGEREFIDKIQNKRRNVTSQRLQAQRKAARYKIISKSRILPESSDDSDLESKNNSKKYPIELYDAVIESSDVEEPSKLESTDITLNLQRLFKENLILDADKYGSATEDYVYDVYEIDDTPFETQNTSGVLSWLRFSESDNEKVEEMGVFSESEQEDEDDSNAEDHYANDYPEEFDSDSEKSYNNYAYDSEYDSDREYSHKSTHNYSGGFYCEDEDYY